MEEELWCIILVSSVNDGILVEEASEMLSIAKDYRQSKDITSLVVYSNKNLLIMLEGVKIAVKEEHHELNQNAGHQSMIKIFDSHISERLFEFPLTFWSISKELRELNSKEPEQKEYFDEFLLMDDIRPHMVRDFIKNNN